MAASADILWAWGLYLLFTCGAIATFFRITRHVRLFWLKAGLRAIVICLFLTPWTIEPDSAQLAPAFIVMLLEAVDQGVAAMWRGAQPILVVLSIALIGVTILSIKRHRVPAS